MASVTLAAAAIGRGALPVIAQDSHRGISENASESESASLLPVFILDSKDDPLTTLDKTPGLQ
jgi:hypothetical protein